MRTLLLLLVLALGASRPLLGRAPLPVTVLGLYKTVAHITVGLLLGLACTDRQERDLWLGVLAFLTIVETLVFLLKI